MSLGTYLHRDSIIHQLPAGIKVLLLLVGGTALFLIHDIWIIGAVLSGIVWLYVLAEIPGRILIAQIRPASWIFLVIFLFQLFTRDAVFAGLVVSRFVALLLLASLVTLSTPASSMIEAVEGSIGGLRRIGINPAKVSLGLSLALRFIPVVAKITAEVREAQRARGLERSVIAVALPVIIRTLKMADDVANAIDARAYDP
ncbi:MULTISPECIES: energy-coupling factor transporter transmembrane component T family protein [unclassified Bradyrhizobium]|uniref:energy-coupling factor transporter transmembrane component T family protein n=1 Tax=unclassified Bradyrhizobium TaxID=2631580 RepID=UPI00230508B7|nr:MULTISPECIES: energy-coupling factor transporter transmembrane protein EcfT [unclassified Bradyrhizobium]MDA9412884.1 cobalt ABC transporter permease [Bradyrhizobium sp. CCBAU 45384]MDA9438426.1 cobalt ABC transporter permease [Bradyrhizobium sp. CCBAU 51745]